MVPGEGYMLYRQRAGEATFVYPFFEPNTTFFDEVSSRSYAYSNNMSLTAVAEGIELQEGDKLIAFADAENVGEATMQGDRIYMTISGDRKTALSFAVERDGEIIATTGQVMNYEVNAISGTYNEPTKIAFVAAEQLPQHGWYTVQGIKLSAKPTRGGVYIYNGRKQVIK
jgi:hypothetical protein